MRFPERYSNLPAYAFPRLRNLLDSHPPGGDVVHMSIGEPKHPAPAWVPDVLATHCGEFGRYPPNEGSAELLEAIAGWIERRYGVTLDAQTRLMALNGTREGLFNAALALCPEPSGTARPVVLTPNPFYQVYAVAALTAGAEPVYVPATAETGFLPDYAGLPPELLDRTEIAFLCSPANPQGAVASPDYWAELLRLAERHDFRIFADECYSEIYRGTAPPGVLEIASREGADPERVIAFHSLSKRSNLPGLRSGFVAAGPQSMARLRQLRAYAGAPLPLPLQRVAERAWSDEDHVLHNRALYARKFDMAEAIFAGIDGAGAPEGGFFLWLPVKDGEEAALRLWRETGVRVLPGAYLSREVDGHNPGAGYVRVALVAPEEELQGGLIRLRDCLYR
ncbi:aminotransferase class I/II-fold pyridoxal phosphate-dependent enzyme [Profundibacterium mesophilum]|uniref:N-succinyldiaminopimelate aminotransferase n=1 Tax=Profundibacterium mesophilum KAUST100406-0324 TaxID=1037889 RepID=A0A921NXH1_9RHOB|nr:aminotransferase class I/II-fold pyridoxal phosphate-dependent enzyme [Profundibacterium mesophilum]KAF0676539.1 N-succinyldiaminopimelate aminotransferase [Profundibacterium mesophilum KAUST100406-0324]